MLDNRAIPEWKLERYLLGELPLEDMQQIEKEVTSNPEVASRLESLRTLDEEMRATLPPCAALVEKEGQTATQRQVSLIVDRLKEFFSGEYMKPALSFGLLLLILTPVIMFNRSSVENTNSPYVATKGAGPSLQIFKKEADSNVVVSAGSTVSPKSLLQIRYLPKNIDYGFIFSVDGNGLITRHFPQAGDTAAKLTTESSEMLPASYELDSAPKFEKFYFVTSEKQFSLSEIERSAEIMIRKESDSLRLSRSFQQYIHPILKD